MDTKKRCFTCGNPNNLKWFEEDLEWFCEDCLKQSNSNDTKEILNGMGGEPEDYYD